MTLHCWPLSAAPIDATLTVHHAAWRRSLSIALDRRTEAIARSIVLATRDAHYDDQVARDTLTEEIREARLHFRVREKYPEWWTDDGDGDPIDLSMAIHGLCSATRLFMTGHTSDSAIDTVAASLSLHLERLLSYPRQTIRRELP